MPQIIVLIFLNRSIGLAFGSDAVKHLYSFVPHITSVNTSFFWTDLTGHDQTYILPILAGALQFIQTWMVTPRPKRNPSQEPDPTAAAQRSMLYVLPLFTVFLGKSITAALFLYWVVSSIFSVIQQYFVNKEKLALAGVSKAIDTAEQKHPEKAKQLEKAKTNPEMKEVLDLETKSEKNGISVTVRRKK